MRSTTCEDFAPPTVLFCDDWDEKHVAFREQVAKPLSIALSDGASTDMVRVLHSTGIESRLQLRLPEGAIVGAVEELVRQYEIDVLVTDLNFEHVDRPKSHGFEIIEQVRGVLGGNVAPFLMTAYGSDYPAEIHRLGFEQVRNQFRVDFVDIASTTASSEQWALLKEKLLTAFRQVVPTIRRIREARVGQARPIYRVRIGVSGQTFNGISLYKPVRLEIGTLLGSEPPLVMKVGPREGSLPFQVLAKHPCEYLTETMIRKEIVDAEKQAAAAGVVYAPIDQERWELILLALSALEIGLDERVLRNPDLNTLVQHFRATPGEPEPFEVAHTRYLIQWIRTEGRSRLRQRSGDQRDEFSRKNTTWVRKQLTREQGLQQRITARAHPISGIHEPPRHRDWDEHVANRVCGYCLIHQRPKDLGGETAGFALAAEVDPAS
jgi:hypothetical protein